MAHERVTIEETDVEQRNQHLERYRFACTHARDRDVLDMACGEGFGSHMLAGSGSRRVTGVDISEGAISKARDKYRLENLWFRVGDAQAMVFREKRFDLIISFETIEHLAQPGKHLTAVSRMLKTDGFYICSTPVRLSGSLNDKPKNPFHFREWNLPEFKGLLNEYFQKIDVFGQSFYFKENPIPFNRTFMKIICKLVFRKELSTLFSEKVLPFPELPQFFNCLPQFQVAVCTAPISM